MCPSWLAKGKCLCVSSTVTGYLRTCPGARHKFLLSFNDSNPCALQSQGECVSLLFPFAGTCCRKTGCPRSTTLMRARDGLPRCENNIRPAGQVAMRERRAGRLRNERRAS